MGKLEKAAAALTDADRELPYLIKRAKKLQEELGYVEATIKKLQDEREAALKILQINY